MDYAQLAARYIELLRKVRALGRPNITAGMTDAQLLECVQQGASESYAYMKECNAILDEAVYSQTASKLDDEAIAGLSAFADKLFTYSASEDCGVAYKIHSLLLQAARERGDEAMLIRELYNCGVTLLFLNISDREHRHSAFGKRVGAYFREGAGYMARYEEFDTPTRGYIIRCLGNCKDALPRRTRADMDEYFRMVDKARGVICSPYYRKLDPSLPWQNYEYSLCLDEIDALSYLRTTPDPEIARRVCEAGEYVHKYCGLYGFDDQRLKNWRAGFFYEAARYHAGKCTAAELVSMLLERAENANSADYTAEGIDANVTTTTRVLTYEPKLEPAAQLKLKPRIDSAVARCMRYLEAMPPSNEPRVVNNAIGDLVDVETAVGTDIYHVRKAFRYLLAGHKPTYIHSLMVALLTRELTARLLEVDPAALLGVCGYTTVGQLRAHAEELCALAYNCGLYHDIGKSMILMYIGTNSRRLIDEEFECIQWHPYLGYQLLCKLGRGADLGEAALYHHRFYNNSGGYPGGCKGCPPAIKPIVDVLSVADSIDAATDGIGRCYTMAKPFETLVGELRAQSGTRYSPAVTALFSDKAFTRELGEDMYAEREQVYVHVYRSGLRDNGEQKN